MGNFAGYQATNAEHSNFLGYAAGYLATNAEHSNFLTSNAGRQATNASDSNFLGNNAGEQATNAFYSNFLGQSAGFSGTNASYSNFLGNQAGSLATNASNSNFFGQNAGFQATNASYSNFLGSEAGFQATNAENSNFIGNRAGYNLTGTENNIAIGTDAGYKSSGYSATNCIFVGASCVSAASGSLSNAIGIGNSLSLTTSNTVVIGDSSQNVGIGGLVNPAYKLDVSGDGRFTSNLLVQGTITETSAERYKENIAPLSGVLDLVSKLNPVYYNKIGDDKTEIGFIAEELNELFPYLVEKNEEGQMEAVNYSRIVVVLAKAIIELREEVKKLKQRRY